MNKKGIIEEQGSWLVNLFFLAILTIIFLGVISKVQDNTNHDLNVEVRDYSYTRDAVSLASNKVSYVYDKKPNIMLDIKDDCIFETKTEKVNIQTRYTCSRKNVVVQQTKKDNKIILENVE